MQQTLEQYGFPTFSSREPTHCMNATLFGVSPEDEEEEEEVREEEEEEERGDE